MTVHLYNLNMMEKLLPLHEVVNRKVDIIKMNQLDDYTLVVNVGGVRRENGHLETCNTA